MVITSQTGYIIVSIGNQVSEDYICARRFCSSDNRQVFLNLKDAEEFCKELQTEYDLDDPDNPYEFKIEEVDVVTRVDR